MNTRDMAKAWAVESTKEEQMEPDTAYLKTRINTLLWEVLPGATPLAEAEKLACLMFEAVLKCFEKWGPGHEEMLR